MNQTHTAENDLCHEFIETGDCGHTDEEHDAIAGGSHTAENDALRLTPEKREAMVRIIVKAALWGWDAHEAGAQRATVEQTATTCVIPPAEGRRCLKCGASMVTRGESFPYCPTCVIPPAERDNS